MSKDSFLFSEPVSTFDVPHPIGMEPKAKIKLVQNGYELSYEGKEFIAKNLDEGLKMIRRWMETKEKQMSKPKKKEVEIEIEIEE